MTQQGKFLVQSFRNVACFHAKKFVKESVSCTTENFEWWLQKVNYFIIKYRLTTHTIRFQYIILWLGQ